MKLLFILNLVSFSLFGQFANTMQLEEDTASPPATLEIMNWLRGEWVGEGLGGLCEEIWSPVRGGSMLGTFRVIEEDKLRLSEYMEIVEADGSILLRLKHYGNDFVGWEEKDKYVEFKLAKIDGNTIYFDGLTYRKTGENTMEVYVVISSGDNPREAKVTYARVDH